MSRGRYEAYVYHWYVWCATSLPQKTCRASSIIIIAWQPCGVEGARDAFTRRTCNCHARMLSSRSASVKVRTRHVAAPPAGSASCPADADRAPTAASDAHAHDCASPKKTCRDGVARRSDLVAEPTKSD